MTLTEFLLARIAEDETVATAADEGLNAGGRPQLDPLYEWGNDWGGGLGITKARVLAECEAKRRIVEGFDCYTTTRDAGWMITDIFKLLAVPYADHPQFQPEWTP